MSADHNFKSDSQPMSLAAKNKPNRGLRLLFLFATAQVPEVGAIGRICEYFKVCAAKNIIRPRPVPHQRRFDRLA